MMRLALEKARDAAACGEVPVGAVVARGDEVIACAANAREHSLDPTAHAEVLALREAARKLGRRRLSGCTLYVTLEPCPMCAGAVMNAGLKRLVYGAFDDKNGACASVATLFDEKFTHIPMVRSRVLKERCGEILSEFFKDKR